MVASVDTITRVVEIIVDELSPEQRRLVIERLAGVPDNKSFRVAVGRLIELIMSDVEE